VTDNSLPFTPNFIRITPFMIVEDLEKALAFFVDLLDFELRLRWPDYAYVQRETAGFRIWQQNGQGRSATGDTALCLLHRRAGRGSAVCGIEAETGFAAKGRRAWSCGQVFRPAGIAFACA
jgi:catechol 2,3-dioxygenase-like lactoylglutathione lyase family enzyme